MKILVVSDSHDRLENLMKMWEREVPSVVLFAGDYSEDCEELSYIYPKSKYYIVRGNCDYMDGTKEDIEELFLGDKKIFLTHGHLFNVKSNYDHIRIETKERGADICIFGHTHKPYIENKDNIILFNPGAVKDGLYGVINIKDGKIELEHKKL